MSKQAPCQWQYLPKNHNLLSVPTAQFKVSKCLYYFLYLYYYSNVVASEYQKSQTKLHKFEIFSERME